MTNAELAEQILLMLGIRADRNNILSVMHIRKDLLVAINQSLNSMVEYLNDLEALRDNNEGR